jgi:hypothetical protein
MGKKEETREGTPPPLTDMMSEPPALKPGRPLPPEPTPAAVQLPARAPGEHPQRVPLVKQEEGPPTAVLAGDGPLPRVIHENERAPRGTTRYLVHATVPDTPVSRLYVLAQEGDKQGAVLHYLAETNGRRCRKIFDNDPASPTFNTMRTVELPTEVDAVPLPD